MTAATSEFASYRANTVGHDLRIATPYGDQSLLYADWTASGRLYRPIETQLLEEIGPWLGNTHSEASVTGQAMTQAYRQAHRILKGHVGAGDQELILTVGTGMTGAINKLQRLLGLKAPQGLRSHIRIAPAQRPVVFVTHMEHHSRCTCWPKPCSSACRSSLSLLKDCTTTWWCSCSATALASRPAAAVPALGRMATTCCMSIPSARTALLPASIRGTSLKSPAG